MRINLTEPTPSQLPAARGRVVLACLLGISLGAFCSRGSADDWPRFRGPARNGHSNVTSHWQAGEWRVKKAWSVQVAQGASSPVIHGDKLYVCGSDNEQELFYCINVVDGRIIWRQQYRAPLYGRHARGDQGLYAGISTTPEIDTQNDLAFTLGVDGDLRCWDLKMSGNCLWSVNLYDDFEMPQRPKVGRSGHRDYGYTSSPMLYKDVVVVEAGSPEHGTLIAFDKRTGTVRWKSQCKKLAGHTAGPTPITIERTPCVAVLHFDGLLVARLDGERAGQTVAEVPWRTDFGNNIASPAVYQNNVLVTSHYNHQMIARYRITLRDGASQVWKTPYASKVCTPVIADQQVYWAWQQLWCLDWETGKLRWKGGRFGDAGSCIATSDNRLIVWGGRGKLTLADRAARSADQFRQLAEVKQGGAADAWPHVAIAAGRLFCKDRKGRLNAMVFVE